MDGVELLSSADVQQHIKDLGVELERRYVKAKKYKRLYSEQREKNNYLCQIVDRQSRELSELKQSAKVLYIYI